MNKEKKYVVLSLSGGNSTYLPYLKEKVNEFNRKKMSLLF